jgi:hypothetical protein
VKSLATTRFWQLYSQLPEVIRSLADKNYKLWQQDTRHPSLHFKRVKGSQELYSIHIGAHYRAVARVKGDVAQWVWIGTHEEYNGLVSQR